jgi:translation initiation factor IF-2
MANKRVHQLAKELGITSKELLGVLQSMGEDINNPLSSVGKELEEAVKEKLSAPSKEKKVSRAAEKERAKGKGRVSKEAAPGTAAVREKGKEKTAAKEDAGRRVVEQRKKPEGVTPREAGTSGTTAKEKRAGRVPAKEARRGEAQREKAAGTAAAKSRRAAGERRPSTLPMKKKIRVTEGLSVRELAQKTGRRQDEILRLLRSLGESADPHTPLNEETILILAEEMGLDVKVKTTAVEVEKEGEREKRKPEPRPPVVTVMGHVDHGKTSLLDAIRKTSVTEKEYGGITQHIGASVVEHEGNKIVFIDTPGHESFTALRARGARVTDIAVLVVAADDGVMPQTIEAIDHANAAQVPVLVAVNKIDKPEANPARVRQQLTEFNLVPEEWGGDTVFVDVSAKEGTNLDQLLEMIVLLAEIHDLRADPHVPAEGFIIEARLDRGKGPVATLLVKEGTLRRGDAVVAGRCYGKVRALFDDRGRQVKEAGPSIPVEVLGLNSVPLAGDRFMVVKDEKTARAIVEQRTAREKAEENRRAVRSFSLEELFQQLQEGETQEFNLIIKGDTQGSVEAVRDSVKKMATDEVAVNIVHSGVGAVTANDVMLAKASGAIIIGFNVRPEPRAKEEAEREGVEIRTYRVIYQLLEDIEAALKGMLKPEYEEVQVGLLEVRATFRVPKLGVVAGALVKEGEITRNSKVRLVRDGKVIYEGSVASLKRFKDDVRSVAAGYECGVGLENFQDIKEGDIMEVLEVREKSPGEEGRE